MRLEKGSYLACRYAKIERILVYRYFIYKKGNIKKLKYILQQESCVIKKFRPPYLELYHPFDYNGLSLIEVIESSLDGISDALLSFIINRNILPLTLQCADRLARTSEYKKKFTK